MSYTRLDMESPESLARFRVVVNSIEAILREERINNRDFYRNEDWKKIVENELFRIGRRRERIYEQIGDLLDRANAIEKCLRSPASVLERVPKTLRAIRYENLVREYAHIKQRHRRKELSINKLEYHLYELAVLHNLQTNEMSRFIFAYSEVVDEAIMPIM